jgi:4-hydroxymandelate oxidase
LQSVAAIADDLSTLRTVEDYRRRASEIVPEALFESMFGTPGDDVGRTDAANRAAFAAVGLRPRVLVDVSECNLATTVLGRPVDLPIMLAPVGGMTRVHAQAELAAVRAASRAGVAMAVSLAANVAAAELVAETAAPLWFQLYVLRDRDATRRLVEHAEEIGCAAIVVTVDNPGLVAKDVSGGRKYVFGTIAALGLDEVMDGTTPLLPFIDPTLTWRDLEWLCSLTSLPVVVKGIRTLEDAALCRETGVDGLVVSNHGGHVVADPVGTLLRLPGIVEAAGELEVYLDGGVREGADVLKALALGARAVLVGRALYWGLAAGGEAGLAGLLTVLRQELETTARFCGIRDVTAVDRTAVSLPAPAFMPQGL